MDEVDQAGYEALPDQAVQALVHHTVLTWCKHASSAGMQPVCLETASG